MGGIKKQLHDQWNKAPTNMCGNADADRRQIAQDHCTFLGETYLQRAVVRI